MFVQHAQTRALRNELALLRADQQALADARAENARLKAAQPTPAELASLRADHAAAERLRAELNTLRDSIRKAEAAVKD